MQKNTSTDREVKLIITGTRVPRHVSYHEPSLSTYQETTTTTTMTTITITTVITIIDDIGEVTIRVVPTLGPFVMN